MGARLMRSLIDNMLIQCQLARKVPENENLNGDMVYRPNSQKM